MSTESVASETAPSPAALSPAVPNRLSDDELTVAVQRFASAERASTAQLVAHLAEFDARRLHLAAGFPSLFAYCCEVLRLSEHATYNRIEAARAARRFPVILGRLADGSLNLTAVRLLSPHLTPDNHRQLLDEASGCSRRAIEEIVARLNPRPDVAASIRRLPAAASAAASGGGPASSSASPPAIAGTPSVTLVTLKSRQPVVVLAPGRYEIRFTASAATREKLRTAQDLLRHAVPDGDTAEVVDRALTALIEALSKAKSAATSRPREASSSPPISRNVPAAVRRAVWLRDGGRCAFVAIDGRRCAAHAFLEFHHIHPYARGGPATVANVALRCHAHNQHERELVFGPRPNAKPPGRPSDLVTSRSTRSETS